MSEPSNAEIASGGAPPAPGTLNQLFFDAVKRYDKPDALQYKPLEAGCGCAIGLPYTTIPPPVLLRVV